MFAPLSNTAVYTGSRLQRVRLQRAPAYKEQISLLACPFVCGTLRGNKEAAHFDSFSPKFFTYLIIIC